MGFSGGEKKRAELLQMRVLEPKLAILDEMDSGLDADGLRMMAEEIKKMANASFWRKARVHYNNAQCKNS